MRNPSPASPASTYTEQPGKGLSDLWASRASLGLHLTKGFGAVSSKFESAHETVEYVNVIHHVYYGGEKKDIENHWLGNGSLTWSPSYLAGLSTSAVVLCLGTTEATPTRNRMCSCLQLESLFLSQYQVQGGLSRWEGQLCSFTLLLHDFLGHWVWMAEVELLPCPYSSLQKFRNLVTVMNLGRQLVVCSSTPANYSPLPSI